MKRTEQAREYFLSGYNCAQSVILSFADDMKFSKELTQKISAGFGGGMGKTQETCGAVTGAIMVLGLRMGEKVNNNDELKNKTYAKVQDLTRTFTREFKSTRCRDIVGVDLNSKEGERKFKEEHMMENLCARCVERAVAIVEGL
ncbi:MAG: C-GCAxxG-C-C family protein [Bacteroidales bacterium]